MALTLAIPSAWDSSHLHMANSLIPSCLYSNAAFTMRPNLDYSIYFYFFEDLFISSRDSMAFSLWGDRERISSRLYTEGAQWRAQSHDLEIMTCTKIKSGMLNPLSHPGTPGLSHSKSQLTYNLELMMKPLVPFNSFFLLAIPHIIFLSHYVVHY